MRSFGLTSACVLAGALGCTVASLQAAPLPTNVEAMKSIVADTSIQVQWGGWRGRGWGRGFGGWGYRGWGWGPAALAGALIGGAIASSAYPYYGGPYYGAYTYYPAYAVPYYGPYYYGPAIQEPGAFGFRRPYGPWGYW
jgi:hypothetical protein